MKLLYAMLLSVLLTGCATVYHNEYTGIDAEGQPYHQANDYITTWGDVTVTIGKCGPSDAVPADTMTCIFVDGAAISDMMSNMLSGLGGVIVGALPFLIL